MAEAFAAVHEAAAAIAAAIAAGRSPSTVRDQAHAAIAGVAAAAAAANLDVNAAVAQAEQILAAAAQAAQPGQSRPRIDPKTQWRAEQAAAAATSTAPPTLAPGESAPTMQEAFDAVQEAAHAIHAAIIANEPPSSVTPQYEAAIAGVAAAAEAANHPVGPIVQAAQQA